MLDGLLIFPAIGAVAGWLAGMLMKGGGIGLLGSLSQLLAASHGRIQMRCIDQPTGGLAALTARRVDR